MEMWEAASEDQLEKQNLEQHKQPRETLPEQNLSHPTRQTRDIETMLVQCWASVIDASPALSQNWSDVSRVSRVTLASVTWPDWYPRAWWGGMVWKWQSRLLTGSRASLIQW